MKRLFTPEAGSEERRVELEEEARTAEPRFTERDVGLLRYRLCPPYPRGESHYAHLDLAGIAALRRHLYSLIRRIEVQIEEDGE